MRLIKVFSVLLLTTFIGKIGIAQNKIGFQLGVTNSKINLVSVDNNLFKSINGYNLGFIFAKALNERFDLNIELNLNIRGGKIEGETTIESGNRQYTHEYNDIISLAYIDIPVTSKFFINQGKNIYLEGGVSFSYLWNAVFLYDEINSVESNDDSYSLYTKTIYMEDIKDQMKNFDLSYVVKIGYEKLFSNENRLFFVNLGYHQGIIELSYTEKDIFRFCSRIQGNIGFLFEIN